MLEEAQIRANICEVLQKYPAVEAYLRRIAQRVVKNGDLQGRMKLGEKLPKSVMNALYTLFPSAALQTDQQGSTTLRFELLNIAQEDVASWLSALCSACDINPNQQKHLQAQALQEAQKLLDRCRLSFPELAACWEMERIDEISALVLARTAPVVQQEYFQFARALSFLLSAHEPLGLADFSARCFGDSKVLKTTPSLVRKLADSLLTLRDEEITDAARQEIWEDYGVVENATAIKVTIFGPLVYFKQGERFDWIAQMYQRGEPACLCWDNLRGIDAISLPENTPVITCENETPFNSLIRESCAGLVIYTAGYPNSAVTRQLQLLPNNITIQHWGDSDVDGLRIAAILQQILPVQLWRCELQELKQNRAALIPLSAERKRKAREFSESHPYFPFHDELTFTIENGWLEQESWRAGL